VRFETRERCGGARALRWCGAKEGCRKEGCRNFKNNRGRVAAEKRRNGAAAEPQHEDARGVFRWAANLAPRRREGSEDRSDERDGVPIILERDGDLLF
jgi:hypothetical protein